MSYQLLEPYFENFDVLYSFLVNFLQNLISNRDVFSLKFDTILDLVIISCVYSHMIIKKVNCGQFTHSNEDLYALVLLLICCCLHLKFTLFFQSKATLVCWMIYQVEYKISQKALF